MARNPEQEALARLRNRDPRGFDWIYDAYAPRVHGFLLRLSGRRDVADDLLQHAFLRLAERDVPLALRQLLSGDAAQRAVAAGHFGLEAPQQASGRAWLAPVLARLLDDPYAAVRRIAARALATMPAGRNLEYDYVAPSPERQRAQQAVIQRWRSRAANIPGDPGVSFARKALDSGLLERLSEQRDDTPIVVNE